MKKKKKSLTFLLADKETLDEAQEKIIIDKQDNKPKLVKLFVGELSHSKLNPSVRTRKSSLKGLKNSLVKYGQLEPIAVELRGNGVKKIVNGHRRCECFKALGWEEIDAIVLGANQADYDATFTAMHADTLKITTVQECERWLKGATNISTSTKSRISALQDRLGIQRGRMVIKRCVTTNKSPGTIASALVNYEKYIAEKALNDDENMKVAYWMLNIGSSWKLSAAIAAFIPKELLVHCVDNQLPIPEDWAHRIGEFV